MQMLSDERDAGCCGGQLVLLTGSSLVLRPMKAENDEPTIAMHTIAFPSRSARVAHEDASDGLDLAVDDDENYADDDEERRPTSEGGATKTQARLVSALLQILRFDSPVIDTPTQVSTLFTSPLSSNEPVPLRSIVTCLRRVFYRSIESIERSLAVMSFRSVANQMTVLAFVRFFSSRERSTIERRPIGVI